VRRAALVLLALLSLIVRTHDVHAVVGVGPLVGPVLNSFTPKNLVGLSLWLRGDLGVTASGGYVSAWADQSGSGHNFAQAGGTTFSPQTATGINGQATLQFGATSNQVLYGASNFTSLGAKNFAVVYEATVTPSSFYSLLTLATSGDAFSELLLSNLGAPYQPFSFYCDFTSATAVGVSNAIDTNPHAVVVTYNGGTNTSTSSYTFTLDNASQTVLTGGTLAPTSTDPASVGARSNSSGVGTGTLTGHIAEVIVWTTSSGTDAANLHKYFNARYGSGVG
jgi:hypothetical protein